MWYQQFCGAVLPPSVMVLFLEAHWQKSWLGLSEKMSSRFSIHSLHCGLVTKIYQGSRRRSILLSSFKRSFIKSEQVFQNIFFQSEFYSESNMYSQWNFKYCSAFRCHWPMTTHLYTESIPETKKAGACPKLSYPHISKCCNSSSRR